uniref:Uncharacterized protein n=1 Tax=Chelydra serpentina TaxID=8475 RepID=A0A8C3SFB3_CHESE
MTPKSQDWLKNYEMFFTCPLIFPPLGCGIISDSTFKLKYAYKNTGLPVDKYLKHRDFLERRKKEIQYKKWLERVSEPLLQKIEDKVDSQSSEEIEERKRKQLSLYLNYCNKKGKVALEDYDSSEYDPLFLNTHPTYLKVRPPPFWLAIVLLFTLVIVQLPTGRIYSAKEMNDLCKGKLPLLPLGRQNMDAAEWLKIPPGYVESEIRQRKSFEVFASGTPHPQPCIVPCAPSEGILHQQATSQSQEALRIYQGHSRKSISYA